MWRHAYTHLEKQKTTQPAVRGLTTSRAMIPLGKSFPLGSVRELPAQHPTSLILPGFKAVLLGSHLSLAYK